MRTLDDGNRHATAIPPARDADIAGLRIQVLLLTSREGPFAHHTDTTLRFVPAAQAGRSVESAIVALRLSRRPELRTGNLFRERDAPWHFAPRHACAKRQRATGCFVTTKAITCVRPKAGVSGAAIQCLSLVACDSWIAVARTRVAWVSRFAVGTYLLGLGWLGWAT